ncbi:hypothetical protein [Nocardia sp. N2S4-5]|uniref:hypothetical protein n=1 Tax=Nocardia sp. N2S4-5 TaxID=3351565 RepID=UPI0037D3AC98
MTDPDLTGLPRDLLAAVYHASAVITIGPHPDQPGTGIAHTWRTNDAPGGPIPAAIVAAKLRAAADDIERAES